jgi:ABC transporter substrate binding protein
MARLRRREFIAVLGGIAVPWLLDAHAQQTKVHRIGFLTRKTDASVSAQINAFRQGLRDHGWVEGTSIAIEYRDAEGQADRLRALAVELVALNVDVIVTVDTPPTQAAKQATSAIPIVGPTASPRWSSRIGGAAQWGSGPDLLATQGTSAVEDMKPLRLSHPSSGSSTNGAVSSFSLPVLTLCGLLFSTGLATLFLLLRNPFNPLPCVSTCRKHPHHLTFANFDSATRGCMTALWQIRISL